MKKILLILLVIVMIASTLVGCVPEENLKMGDSVQQDSQKMADNQDILKKKHPVPDLTWSNNRANIVKKLDTFGSDPNKVSWIYCFLPAGQCVLFTSVKGCVTNLSAYAVPDDNIVTLKIPNLGVESFVMQAPDADGTYGTNGEGIYWYDTAGVYHEWNGFYMLMDQPQKLNIEPLITMNTENR